MNTIPEKWCIKRTEDNYTIINKWINDNLQHKKDGDYVGEIGYIHFPKQEEYSHYTSINPKIEYEEISFEQFEEYILGKAPIINENYDYLIELLTELNIK